MDTEGRIAIVAPTWAPGQQLEDCQLHLPAGYSSVLYEPVGTVPGHARKGLPRAVCHAVLNAARDLGACVAVVGPRGDPAYPVPRRLYESIAFTTMARTEVLAWR